MLKQRKERGSDDSDPQMTPRQMLLRIIEIVSGEGMTEDKLEKILRAAEGIAAEGKDKA